MYRKLGRRGRHDPRGGDRYPMKHLPLILFVVMFLYSANNDAVKVEYTLDDVTGNITQVAVTNLTGSSVFLSVARAADPTVSYSKTFAPGTSTLNIPTNAAGRIQTTLVNGKIEGVNWNVVYPAP